MEEESGECAYKTSCKGCGSSDANQVYSYTDGRSDNSYCFACEKFDPMEGEVTPAPKKKKAPIDHTKEIARIKTLPIKAIPERKITQQTCEEYRVRVGVSTSDGETITDLYSADTLKGKLVGYEWKIVKSKNFISIGERSGELDLWGSWVAKKSKGFNKLFITEGRLDALSLYQVIKDKEPGSKYAPSVVSLTRGTSSAVKDLMNNRDLLSKYKEVILCFDQDKAGLKATREVLKVFPSLKTTTLPLEDASDMLMEGREEELYKAAVWESSFIRQGEVVDVHDIIENAMTKPKMGISFPWPTVTKACFGIRPNTIHVVGAAPKIGKTDHQHQLVHHLVYNEGVKVGMFDLENSPVKTAKKLASKQAKKDFTRPDVAYEDSELRDTLMSLDGKVRFYDRGASRDWEDIRIAIEEMHLLDGINIFIIDPLTALISKYNSSEANEKLNLIMTDCSDLVSKFPITLFFYSHVNPKPKSSTPHEKGARVYSSEFTGSRAMEKWSHYGHGISRDRTDECPPERKNVSEFYMLFDREFGNTYTCEVYFDTPTVTYLEPTKGYTY
jgi:twinkle protein